MAVYRFLFIVTLQLLSARTDQTSNGYSTQVFANTEGNQCEKEIIIKGNGVDDTFTFPCSSLQNTFSSNDDILIAGQDTVQVNSVYSKEPGKVQVIMNGRCFVRTYTFSGGRTSATTWPVGDAECDAMKQEHLERLRKFQKWSSQTFPPCFPYCNTANPGSAAAMNTMRSNAVPNYRPWSANPAAINIPSSYFPQRSLVQNHIPRNAYPAWINYFSRWQV